MLDLPPGLLRSCLLPPGECVYGIEDGSELLEALQRIYQGAALQLRRDQVDEDCNEVVCRLPPDQPSTPASCCHVLDGTDADGDDLCDPNPAIWQTATWSALGFSRVEPHAYVYGFLDMGSDGSGEFAATARLQVECSPECEHAIQVTGNPQTGAGCELQAPTHLVVTLYSGCPGTEGHLQDYTGEVFLGSTQKAGFLPASDTESFNPGFGDAADRLVDIANNAANHYSDYCAFPVDQGATPIEDSCCQSLGGLDEDGDGQCDVDATMWAAPAWQSVSFSIDEQQPFVYSMSNDGGYFRAVARGDQDCDGLRSEMRVCVKPLSPTAPCQAQTMVGYYTSFENE